MSITTPGQHAELQSLVGRHDVLIRQLQGAGLRVVDALPEPGRAGALVLFGGAVWVDTGAEWKQLAYA